MTLTILEALKMAIQALGGTFDTPRLDAEILLQIVIKKPRVYFLTHPEGTLSQAEISHFQTLLKKRAAGYPIAYLRGSQEFWSLEFKVTPDVLIPRPETENLVEVALEHIQNPFADIADIGTGSGCIAIALARERPLWQITATDIQQSALTLAEENARSHDCAHIRFVLRSLLQDFKPESLDAILSNPPYIAKNDPDLEASVAQYEPQTALIAENAGLALLFQIIQEAYSILKIGGLLILEHGIGQDTHLNQAMQKRGYQNIRSICDLQGIKRVILGRRPEKKALLSL